MTPPDLSGPALNRGTPGLTSKQSDMLAYLRASESGGFTPSFAEMKDALGLKSTSGAHRLIEALEERGFIERIRNRARSIRVLAEPRGLRGRFDGVPSTYLAAELRSRGWRVDAPTTHPLTSGVR